MNIKSVCLSEFCFFIVKLFLVLDYFSGESISLQKKTASELLDIPKNLEAVFYMLIYGRATPNLSCSLR